MSRTEVREVRGGMQVSYPAIVPTYARESRESEFDELRHAGENLVRNFQKAHLILKIDRLLPSHTLDPEERRSLMETRLFLEKAPKLDDAFLRKMGAAVEARLARIPAARRSVGFNAQTRATSEDRVITFVVSDESVIDRHGTIVRLAGLQTDKYLQRNAVVGFMHNLYGGGFNSPNVEHVIGRTLRLRVEGSTLQADIEFLPESVNRTAEQVFQMVKRRVLSATSIGFIPKRVVVERHDGREVPVITEAELLEISVVAIPSNGNVGVVGGRARTA